MGQLTHTRRSDGVPDPDGDLKESVRIKIRHYRNLYVNRPDPMTFLPAAVDTSGDFIRFLFLHAHLETSVLANELPEESNQFRSLRDVCFTNLKGAVGLIMTKVSAMRISIPLDLSSRSQVRTSTSFHPLASTHTPLTPSLVFFPPCSG